MRVSLAVVAALALLFASAPAAVEASKCSECEMVVGFVEGWIGKNASVSAIVKDLDEICAKIPGISAVCDTLVSYGIPTIVGWLEKHESPKTVCTKIHLCTNTSAEAPKKLLTLKPKKAVSSKKAHTTALKGGECELCTYVIGAVESWISNGANEQEIEAALDHVCSIVPGFSSTCDAIVAAGVPTVISWIENNENSTRVCQQLGACSGSSAKKIAPKPKKSLKKFGDECSECQTVIGAIESWMAENATEAWIVNLLENSLCKLIPAFETTCDAIAEEGIPTVLQWIEEAEDPATVCKQLDICSSASTKKSVKKISIEKKTKKHHLKVKNLKDDCSECKAVIGAIEHWLSQNSSIQYIDTMLEDTLCKLVPAFETTCDAIAQAGVPTVIQWIEEAEDPATVCKQLDVCSSKQVRKAKHHPKLQNFKDDCSECKSVIGAIEHWLAQNSSIQYIDNLLEDTLCKIVPAFETTCDAIAQAGVPTVIEWIEEAEDPATVCGQLDLCGKSAVKKHAKALLKKFLKRH